MFPVGVRTLLWFVQICINLTVPRIDHDRTNNPVAAGAIVASTIL